MQPVIRSDGPDLNAEAPKAEKLVRGMRKELDQMSNAESFVKRKAILCLCFLEKLSCPVFLSNSKLYR